MIIGTSKDTTTTRVYEQGQHGASFALRDFPDFATRWRSTRGSDGTRTRTLLRDSIEVPGLGVSFFAIPDAVRLDDPKLMLWRELQQHGDEARFKRATSVGLSWDSGRKTGWDFGGYAWTFSKSKSNVINTRSSVQQRSESTESPRIYW